MRFFVAYFHFHRNTSYYVLTAFGHGSLQIMTDGLVVQDLIRCTLVCKGLRSILLSVAHEQVWRSARHALRMAVPAPFPDISEQKWATFLFGSRRCKVRTLTLLLLSRRANTAILTIEAIFALALPRNDTVFALLVHQSNNCLPEGA